MHAFSFRGRSLSIAALFVGALLAAVPFDTYSDPPPWAPAHGWRKKHDPYYVGYTGRKWDKDYEIVSGRCNREAVGAVLGGVVGGVAGSQVGKGTGRQIAILAGAIAGAVIGAQIGRDMDRADQACLAHALELAGDNKRVTWASADHRTTYVVTPVRGFKYGGQTCREFDFQAKRGGRSESGRGKACPNSEGTWRIVG